MSLPCLLFVPHVYDDTMILLCVCACDMSCALSMPIICSHEMIAMISSSMLHLRTTSLHNLIAMIDCYVASPMFHYLLSWVDDIYAHASHMIYLDHCILCHTCSSHAVDDNYLYALHMIHIASCHISPCVASLMLDDLPCTECNNDSLLAHEIAPIAFSHIFGDFDIFL